MAITQSNTAEGHSTETKHQQDTPDLPRTTENYELTFHAVQRKKERDRMLNESIIANTIKKGELKPAGGDESKFVNDVAATTYIVIVGNEPDGRGVHNIVSAYTEE